MTSKEKKQINHVLFCQIVAGTRNEDKTKMLNALAYDIAEILNGREPTESQRLFKESS